LEPESGQSYDITVPPGGNKTIVIKMDPEGYSMSSSSTSSILHGDGQLQKLCLETGKKAARPDPETGEECAIY